MPVAHDFRSADMAAGGEGAPLAPVFHAALAAALDRPLAVLNIGGVANVTWIGADGALLACDTGPGNGPLDDWIARPYRRRLSTATARWRPRAGRMRRCWRGCSRTPISRGPPRNRSTGWIFPPPSRRAASRRFPPPTARRRWWRSWPKRWRRAPLPAPPRRWLVGGGGRHNPAIMAALRARLPAPVEPVEDVGWDGDALEAQCFGFLAVRVRRGLPLSYPGHHRRPPALPRRADHAAALSVRLRERQAQSAASAIARRASVCFT